MKHKELVDIAYKWACRNHSFVFKEFTTYANETPDVIGFRSYYTTLIECKTNVSDFKADERKISRRFPEQSMGNYRIYCMPSELYQKINIPEGWGVLLVKNNKARMLESASRNDKNFHPSTIKKLLNENMMMFSALRRFWLRGHFEKIYEPLEGK